MDASEKIQKEIHTQFGSITEIIQSFYSSYKAKNSWKLRIVDSFIIFNFLILFIQLAYVVLVGTFPKNSFLSGIICCIGTISLTVSMRLSITNNKKSKQSIFLEYLFSSLILYLVIINFLG